MILANLLFGLFIYFMIGMLIEYRFRKRLEGFEPIVVLYFWPFIMLGCGILITIKFINNFIKRR